jgi:phosphopantothenoylcysteine decarboxylase/phosphopantothenate--cysteine ligase
MAEPEDIISFIEKDILMGLPLNGKQILITAGPTYEAIDPVRFIGNHSSGKMGFEIAKVAASLGAEVTLITGPTHQTINHSLVKLIPIVSAEEMYTEVHKYFKTSDIAILSAAVADYKAKTVADRKIKKNEETFTIELTRTKDILKSLGAVKSDQFLVGFALETHNELDNALKKLKTKNLDLIVLNSLQDVGAGFGGSTNKVTFITSSGTIIENDLKSKAEVAQDLMEQILKQFHA